MSLVSIKSIYRQADDFVGQEVKVQGWVRTLRASKSTGFIELNDGSFFKNLQIVFGQKIENFNEISKLPISTAITVQGRVVATPDAKQPIEIHANEISVEATSDSDYPLQKKRHSLEYLREIAHLRPRANLFSAVFRVSSVAAYALHRFFQERGYVYVHAPIITSSDAEGAGEMFHVTTLDLMNVPRTAANEVDFSQDFFGKEVGLSVSGQLEAEIFALAYSNVYTFAPTFRAENSHTGRHAAEFWMLEPEIAFADLEDNMNVVEEMLKYVLSYTMAELPEEFAFFDQFVDKGLLARLQNVVDSDFGHVTYTEAIELLKQADREFEYAVEWGIDLQTEHERYLAEQVFKRPVFVTDYPREIKAFYMRKNDDGRTVAAMDLLVPGVGELVGGSQREERYDELKQRIEEMGFAMEDYWWYLELRKYGGVKHSGFGLGFERLIMYMTGVSNIRDVLPCPRTPGNCEF
ncbi:MAG TPA: asparagine--tRNA ligase [Firmicutes bacterium]|nr:asparagine--tRNA ligase [Bacillota bacterium]